MSKTNHVSYEAQIAAEYQTLRDKQVKRPDLLSLDEAKKRKPNLF